MPIIEIKIEVAKEAGNKVPEINEEFTDSYGNQAEVVELGDWLYGDKWSLNACPVGGVEDEIYSTIIEWRDGKWIELQV